MTQRSYNFFILFINKTAKHNRKQMTYNIKTYLDPVINTELVKSY